MMKEKGYESVGGRKTTIKTGKKDKVIWDFGWIPPQNRTRYQQHAAEDAVNEMPRFSIKGTKKDDPKQVILMETWKHPSVIEANGFTFTGTHQLTGSCVGAGGGNALMSLACLDAVIRKDAETPLLPFWLLPYGRSRFYLGDRSPGEGSSGTTFAKAVREDGVVAANQPGLPTFTTTDGFVWGSKAEYAWSDGDAQQTMDLLASSRTHLVKTTAKCNDHNDVREAVRNYYPVTAASNYAHDGGKVQGDPPVSLGRKSGSWSHQMSIQGWWEHPKLGEIFWLQNQWGLKAHTTCPFMQTGAGVWITAKDVDWICNDEVFAFSQYDGFPAQTFSWVV